MRRVLVGLVCTVGLVAWACGGDDGAPAGGDGTPTTGKDGGTSTSRTDSGVAGSCMFDNAPNDTGCTDAQIKVYSDCLQAACKSEYTECYGPDYLKGKFSGPCADFLGCESKCDCNDTTCQSACTPNAACMTCQQKFVSCAVSCIDKLSCATGDLGDAGISFSLPDGGSLFGDKTCADFQTCCNGLADGDQKTECKTVYGQLNGMSNANLLCSAAISSYCP